MQDPLPGLRVAVTLTAAAAIALALAACGVPDAPAGPGTGPSTTGVRDPAASLPPAPAASPEDVDAWVGDLLGSDAGKREHAWVRLVAHQTPAIARRLLDVAKDTSRDLWVRRTALDTLRAFTLAEARVVDDVKPLLRDTEVSADAWPVLARCGEAALPFLMDVVRRAETHGVRAAAIETIADIGRPARGSALALHDVIAAHLELRDDLPEFRNRPGGAPAYGSRELDGCTTSAVRALRAIGADASLSIDAIASCLSRPGSRDLRREAARSLAVLGTQGRAVLLRAADDPECAESRLEIVGAIGDVLGPGRDARAVLTRATKDKDERVRRRAVVALAAQGAPQDAAELLAWLGDPSPAVRSVAAAAAAKSAIRDEAVTARLREIVRGADAQAALSAVAALATWDALGDAAALGDGLPPEVQAAVTAAREAAERRRATVDTLLAQAAAGEVEMRVDAVLELGTRRDAAPHIVPELTAMLRALRSSPGEHSKRERRAIESALVDALGHLGPDAGPALAEAIDTGTEWRRACAALVRTKWDGAGEFLVGKLSAPPTPGREEEFDLAPCAARALLDLDVHVRRQWPAVLAALESPFASVRAAAALQALRDGGPLDDAAARRVSEALSETAWDRDRIGEVVRRLGALGPRAAYAAPYLRVLHSGDWIRPEDRDVVRASLVAIEGRTP